MFMFRRRRLKKHTLFDDDDDDVPSIDHRAAKTAMGKLARNSPFRPTKVELTEVSFQLGFLKQGEEGYLQETA